MRRVFAVLAGLCVVLLVGGFFSLGAFPPKPQLHPVHEMVPMDRLAPAQP